MRFVAEARGVRDLKDAMSRDILAAFGEAGIGIVSATLDIVGGVREWAEGGEPRKMAGEGEGEDEQERRNRELRELLEELRVILPGVEVLFAFLLTLPFSQRFGDLTTRQQVVFFAAFLCTALATALLIAPTAHHRLLWHRRERAKERGLETAARFAIAGTVLLAVAVTGVVFIVADVLFGVPVASAIALLLGGTFAWLWYGLPLRQRLRDRTEEAR